MCAWLFFPETLISQVPETEKSKEETEEKIRPGETLVVFTSSLVAKPFFKSRLLYSRFSDKNLFTPRIHSVFRYTV